MKWPIMVGMMARQAQKRQEYGKWADIAGMLANKGVESGLARQKHQPVSP